MTRLLTIMGSGETAPTMVKTHRSVFDRLAGTADAGADVPAVFLDTPFGFQENAAELSSKTADYFRVSVNRAVVVAGLPRIETAAYEAVGIPPSFQYSRIAATIETADSADRWLFSTMTRSHSPDEEHGAVGMERVAE